MHVVFSSVVSMTFLLFLLSFEMKTKTQNEDVKQTNQPKKNKPKGHYWVLLVEVFRLLLFFFFCDTGIESSYSCCYFICTFHRTTKDVGMKTSIF